MNALLPKFVDERFLEHRRRASSIAGILSACLALVLFMYRYYHDHVFSGDLLAVGVTFVVIKYIAFFFYRSKL